MDKTVNKYNSFSIYTSFVKMELLNKLSTLLDHRKGHSIDMDSLIDTQVSIIYSRYPTTLVRVQVERVFKKDEKIYLVVKGYPQKEDYETTELCLSSDLLYLEELENLVSDIPGSFPSDYIENINNNYVLFLNTLESVFCSMLLKFGGTRLEFDYTSINEGSPVFVPKLNNDGSSSTEVGICKASVSSQRVFLEGDSGFLYKLKDFAPTTIMYLLSKMYSE